MTELLDPLGRGALALVIAAIAWWLSAWPLALGYRLLRRPFRQMPPAQRSTALSLYALLPLVAAALTAAILFTPALGGWLVLPHCHDGLGCSAHAPVTGRQALTPPLLIMALLIGALAALRYHQLASNSRTRLAKLSVLAQSVPDAGYARIECDVPFAVTAGLWHPRIYLSSGLERELDAEGLTAVLAHERAHARRRDPLRLALLMSVAPNALTSSGAPLIFDLQSAAEQCCDAEAARVVGDHLAVADALLHVQRAMRPGGATVAGDLPERITTLIDAPPPRPLLHPTLLFASLAAVGLIALFGVNAAHHGSELVLTLLAR